MQLFVNNATSTLAAAITAAATALSLKAGDGAKFPTPVGGDFFTLTLIGRDANGFENAWEVVNVTARSVDTLTIVRAQEGTTAAAWGVATPAQARPTAAALTTLQSTANTHIARTDNPHATTKAQVGLGNVDNTSDANKPVSTAQAAADATALASAKTYADGLVVGLWDDRGNYDASVNTFPAAGGSGAAGAVLKGDIWTTSVAGTLGGVPVAVKQTLRALIDAPGQTAANWAIGLANTDLDDSITAGVTGRAPSQNAVAAALALKAALNGSGAQDFSMASLNVGGPLAGLRNYFINGCMRVHQRGGAIVIGAGQGFYTLDRWFIYNGHDVAVTVTQATIASFENSDRVSRMRISANAVPTSGSVFITQRVEGSHITAGTPAIMSLLIQTADVGMQARFLYNQNFGSGGSTLVANNYGYYSLGAGVNSATGLRQSQVFSLPSTVGKTVGAGDYLELTFELAIRTTNGHTLTQFQYERGSIATPFEVRPLGLETALCQRYYRKWAVATGFCSIGAGWNYQGDAGAYIVQAGEMRTTPTLAWTNCAVHVATGAQIPITGLSIINYVSGALHLTAVSSFSSATLSAGNGNHLAVGSNNGAPGSITLTAEL